MYCFIVLCIFCSGIDFVSLQSLFAVSRVYNNNNNCQGIYKIIIIIIIIIITLIQRHKVVTSEALGSVSQLCVLVSRRLEDKISWQITVFHQPLITTAKLAMQYVLAPIYARLFVVNEAKVRPTSGRATEAQG